MATLRLGLRVVTYPRKCKRLGTSLPCSADRGRRRAVRIVTNLARQGDSRWRIQENLQPEAILFLLCP
jgi:hypothetical protein